MPTNAKPGKSKHPYDTGIGGTSTRVVGGNSQMRTPSRQTKGAVTPKEQIAQTPKRLQKARMFKSTPSFLRDRTPIPTSQKRNDSNCTPESQAWNGSPSQRKLEFRNILGLNRNRGNISPTSPSEETSLSPEQVSTESETPTGTQRRRWWHFKKQRRTNDERDVDTLDLTGVVSVLDEEEGEDDLVAILHPQGTWKNGKKRRVSRYPRDEVAEKVHETKVGDIRDGTGRGVDHRQQEHQESKKITNSTPLSQKLQRRHRKSISSSQAHPSTAGTSSTPGTATIHKDFAQEDWRETPSPMTPTQVLRFFLGTTRKTPSSRTATQIDLGSPEIGISTSTLPLERKSRDNGRISGRPSMEHNKWAWIPFWGSPKPELDSSLVNSKERRSRRKEYLESAAGPPEVRKSLNMKRSPDKASRKRWRSG
ncbi:hypothetical protein F4804DRAFT_254964 [Jackrogersella minutella]|nr:hypothetical protein F4804DRAFT_254964 [Jackrogersella minutella]